MADEKLESKVLSEINLDKKSLQDGVKHLIDWISKQPHLPNITDEELLKAFIVGSKSVERAKDKLDRYYKARTKYPIAFSPSNRDPKNLQWKQIQRMVLLPGSTPEGYHVILMRIPQTKEDMHEFSFIETAKMFFMLTDYIFKTCPITSGQVVFIDSNNISMEYLTKFITSFTTAVFDMYQHVLPIRMKSCVCFNSSSIAEMFCNKILKVVLGEKLGKRVYAHTGNHEVLSKYIPQDMLPKDYGGKAPSFNQLCEDMEEKFMKQRDWLMNEGCIGSNEALRPKSENDCEQIQGTFRKLQID